MEFREDVLGTPYEAAELPLADDEEGAVSATLVRRLVPGSQRAVLYLHGYTDYFFQTNLADHFAAAGFSFYALDLRKYGRSLRSHQSPNFVRDLAAYDEELDEAVRIIREQDGHTQLLVNGHSTGGLVASLWASRRAGRGLLDGLFLNSPFLAMPTSPALRTLGAPAVGALGRLAATRKLPAPLNPHYVHSLHSDHRGSWDFDLALKPAEGFPLYAGWLAAIQRGHRQVRRGLHVDVPVLLMASTASIVTNKWDPAMHHRDAVLRADDIAALAPRLGPHVTTIRIEGGMHDLVLSGEQARTQVFAELDRWIEAYFPAPPA
ncbi:alpha-beta hydrolase superfamily lysophospholipase [Kitasatospora sp. MAP12-15]|uniref:alpha/beta hydrolase n=1 Tax=unclassified Kitasatospora TaxID=2633591 RepID=UPI002474FDD2|nr:alpha/beta hydrolase [Kitasatospora sp. MAP12-44]MDH6114733.1 alpha-beta hydrolase superfamily lysophospholipase [Kitasatospora sp. MAP12-44]